FPEKPLQDRVWKPLQCIATLRIHADAPPSVISLNYFSLFASGFPLSASALQHDELKFFAREPAATQGPALWPTAIHPPSGTRHSPSCTLCPGGTLRGMP